MLAKVDVDANPQLTQAFRAQSIPMVVALVAGQPVPLFTGAVPEQQVREVFAQLLRLAAQQGVTGSVPVEGQDAEASDDSETPLPPHHQAAYDAIEEGNYARAITAYEAALAENPRDDDARAGPGQVRLLDRVQGLDLQAARMPRQPRRSIQMRSLPSPTWTSPGDTWTMRSGACSTCSPHCPRASEHPCVSACSSLFGLVGDTDARVIRARGRLSSLLF